MGKIYFFIGIGGSGMSAIAQVLATSAGGCDVRGSDRGLDQGKNLAFFDQLRDFGIKLFPQDGSGVTTDCDCVVASTAIEKTVPDMARALELGIPVKHRADALADIFNAGRGIAVGGTSGKSTVTGMTGVLLDVAGLDPTIINGGKMKNYSAGGAPGNARIGASDYIVIESDESDGSIVKYKPRVAVVTNVTRDHKPMHELKELFAAFIKNTRGTAVLNADCPVASGFAACAGQTITYGIRNEADVRGEGVVAGAFSSHFTLFGRRVHINLPGEHNVSNALAAAAAARALGVSEGLIVRGLEAFAGIRRRYDIIGETNGIKVIDDFAHNPDKIRATLETLHLEPGRHLLVFQPHGFGPTNFMRDELVETFRKHMSKNDILFMPEIYYAGGTADRSISSKDIVYDFSDTGHDARFFPSRDDIVTPIVENARPGDTITVMGARDDTLTSFCRSIFEKIKSK